MFVSVILSLSLTSFALFFLVFKLRHWFFIIKKVNEFPSRKGYPIIGNMIDFFGPPDEVFFEIDRLLKEFFSSGTFCAWIFLIPVVAIHDPEDLEPFLGNVANNKKAFVYDAIRPWLGNGLLTSAGEQWHARRKMLTPTFHFNILQKFVRVFNDESKNLVERLKTEINKEVDVVPVVTDYTLNSICETAMGTSLNNMEGGDNYRKCVHDFGMIIFQRITRAWLLIDLIFRLSSSYLKQKHIVKVLHDFSTNVIEKRKKNFDTFSKNSGSDDWTSFYGERKLAMLDLLVSAQRNGENIDDEGIREEVDTFMFEGHDTTSVSICFTLMLLANNRECQDKIYEEILTVFGTEDEITYTALQELKYMDRCIKESLRLYPSVPLIARNLGEDISTKNGHVIPKGCTTVACIYHMHRKEDLYPEPEKFDPDRFLLENVVKRHPYAYVPFSAGPRNCIGQKFAVLEIKCLLTEILKHYILEPVDTPDTIVIITDLVLRPKNPIKVKFVPRR